MKKLLLLFLPLSLVFSAEPSKELPVENSFVDFKSIRNVLKKDGLDKIVKNKIENRKVIEKKKVDISKRLYELPTDQDFWKIILDFWLVQNTGVLKWDFHKPDYGITDYFSSFLREVSEFGVKYNILFLNTTNLTHFAFPYGKNEYLFIVSVPFIKIMDLSKLQISILLYEDLLRVKNKQFESMIDPSLTSNIKNGNFYKKIFPKKKIHDLLSRIDFIVYDKGFDFQQQYLVTKQMKTILNNNKKYWQNYFVLLTKIDDLTKGNLMYKNYAKIYPSPELQLNWINPTKN